MAGKNPSISTDIRLLGEQEWRRAVQACKAELTQFKIEIDLVNATYKNNANSLEALTRKIDSHQKTIDKLKEASELYRARAEKLSDAIKNQQATTQWAQTAVDAFRQKIDEASKSGNKNSEEIKGWTNNLKYWTDIAKASEEQETRLQGELANAQAQINRYEKQIVTTTNALDEFNNTIKNINDIAKMTGQSAEDVDRFLESWSALADPELNKLITSSYDTFVKLIREGLEASIEFESAMAKVQKTTNMSSVELTNFGDRLKKMSTTLPVTTQELANIAETAGQLGIASQDLSKFVETMAMMGVSTNMTSEAAATSLAQLASVTGMTSDNYQNLASSIVEVGNNFATTESAVTAFVSRIAGAANNVSITESEMVGLATAVTSLGIATDAGSTSIQSLINKMETAVSTGNNLETWASVMGMSTEELTVLWRNDAAEAIRVLISSLGELDTSMTTTLTELGIGEQRIIRTVSTLANAEHSTQLLTRAMESSNSAWAEGTALQEEARKAYATTASVMQRYENSVSNLKVAIGDDLTPLLRDFKNVGTDINIGLTEFVQNNPAVVAAFAGLTAAVGALSAASAVDFLGGIDKIKKIGESITTVLTNPLAQTVMVVAALGTAIAVAYANADTATKSARNLAKESENYRKEVEKTIEGYEENNEALEAQIDMLDTLAQKEERSAGEKLLMQSIVQDLNSSISGLNYQYDAMTDTLIDMSTGATVTVSNLRALAQAQAEQQIQAEKVSALKQLYIDQSRYTEELAAKQLALNELLNKQGSLSQKDKEQIIDLRKAIGILEEQLDDTNEAIVDYSKGIEEAEQKTVSIDREAEALVLTLQNQKQAYIEAREAAKSNVEQTLDGFTKITEKRNRTYDDLLKAVNSEIDFVVHLTDNVNNLMGRNIEGVDKLIEKYNDGSVEGARMISSFASLTDKQLTNLVSKLGDLETQVTHYSNTSAKAVTGITEAVGKLQLAIDKVNRTKINVTGSVSVTTNGGKANLGDLMRDDTPRTKSAQGLEYVPYDDYAALLHEGEMVLTKAEARAYRESHTTGQSVTNNNRNYGGVSINVYSRQGQDIDSLADEIMYRIEDATKQKEAVWA